MPNSVLRETAPQSIGPWENVPGLLAGSPLDGSNPAIPAYDGNPSALPALLQEVDHLARWSMIIDPDAARTRETNGDESSKGLAHLARAIALIPMATQVLQNPYAARPRDHGTKQHIKALYPNMGYKRAWESFCSDVHSLSLADSQAALEVGDKFADLTEGTNGGNPRSTLPEEISQAANWLYEASRAGGRNTITNSSTALALYSLIRYALSPESVSKGNPDLDQELPDLPLIRRVGNFVGQLGVRTSAVVESIDPNSSEFRALAPYLARQIEALLPRDQRHNWHVWSWRGRRDRRFQDGNETPPEQRRAIRAARLRTDPKASARHLTRPLHLLHDALPTDGTSTRAVVNRLRVTLGNKTSLAQDLDQITGMQPAD